MRPFFNVFCMLINELHPLLVLVRPLRQLISILLIDVILEILVVNLYAIAGPQQLLNSIFNLSLPVVRESMLVHGAIKGSNA